MKSSLLPKAHWLIFLEVYDQGVLLHTSIDRIQNQKLLDDFQLIEFLLKNLSQWFCSLSHSHKELLDQKFTKWLSPQQHKSNNFHKKWQMQACLNPNVQWKMKNLKEKIVWFRLG
jgi:hypothetical protein